MDVSPKRAQIARPDPSGCRLTCSRHTHSQGFASLAAQRQQARSRANEARKLCSAALQRTPCSRNSGTGQRGLPGRPACPQRAHCCPAEQRTGAEPPGSHSGPPPAQRRQEAPRESKRPPGLATGAPRPETRSNGRRDAANPGERQPSCGQASGRSGPPSAQGRRRRRERAGTEKVSPKPHGQPQAGRNLAQQSPWGLPGAEGAPAPPRPPHAESDPAHFPRLRCRPGPASTPASPRPGASLHLRRGPHLPHTSGREQRQQVSR